MHYFKLTIAYDGADFHGWQQQPNLPTIQGSLVNVLQQLTQEKIMLFGASRTDKGVHALGQVASFRTNSPLTAQEFQRALNALLPPAIRIVAAEEMGPNFHARWLARGKIYHYRIARSPSVSPFDHRYILHHPWPLDESAMAEAARLFEGSHDFTSFSASLDDEDRPPAKTTPEREIYSSLVFRAPALSTLLDIHSGPASAPPTAPPPPSNTPSAPPSNDILIFEIRGRSFLRYMVRKIAGTLLEVGRGRLAPSDIPRIFDARDRSLSGPTLPPNGLILISIDYPPPAL